MPGRNTGLLEGAAAGIWSSGIVEQSQGVGCCWLWRDGSRGCEVGDFGEKFLWSKAGQPWKQGDTAESSVVGGAITIACLSQHISIGSWTIERLAHQMPDVWVYRVGPQPGEAPLRVWMGRAREKDWPKRPSDCQLPKAWKKILMGPWLLQQRQSVSLHTWHRQGLCKPSSCSTFTHNSHWGRAATGKVLCLCVQGSFGCVQLFVTL